MFATEIKIKMSLASSIASSKYMYLQYTNTSVVITDIKT